MADISTWNPVDESNTAAPPAGAPENMQPSAVNNTMRAMMGAIRRWYDTLTVQLAGFLPLTGGTVTGNLGVTGTLSAAQYNINSIPFASNDGVTTHIYDATGGNAMHLQAAINYYDADSHVLRNNAGAVNQLVVTGGNLTISGNYLFFAGATGAANTTGGPLIYADVSNHVYKQGSGNGAFIFQNYAGTNVAQISSAGGVSGAGLATSGNIDAAGTITGSYVHSTGNVIADVDIGCRDLNISRNVNAPGTVTGAQLTSTGNINASGTVTGAQLTSTGNINASSTIAGAYINSSGHIDVATYVYAPDGFQARDSSGALQYRLYASGGFGYHNYVLNWFWRFDDTNGNLTWFRGSPTIPFWEIRATDSTCLNALGPVAGLGAYINTSDRRTKENVVPTARGLSEILRLTPVEFDRISSIPMPREIGFTAQDVIDVLPEAVRVVGIPLSDGTGGLEDAEPSLGITDSTIVAALVNAVKELNTRLSALEETHV